MEQVSPARRETPADVNQILDEAGRDPRAARDVAAGEPWVFFEHQMLNEILAAERCR